jgi:hypothetical protein
MESEKLLNLILDEIRSEGDRRVEIIPVKLEQRKEYRRRIDKLKIYIHYFLGNMLLILFFSQWIFKWEWSYLINLQKDEVYKRWTGLILATFILMQFSLTISRSLRSKYSKRHYSMHKWMGILAPVLFYFHSVKFGYAYLFLLSCVYFANVMIGFLNKEVLKINAQWYSQYWMMLHVTLGVFAIILMLYHIWVSFYWK